MSPYPRSHESRKRRVPNTKATAIIEYRLAGYIVGLFDLLFSHTHLYPFSLRL